jgi:hypothetical protein
MQVNRSPIPEQAYNGVTLASPTQNVLKNVVTANKQYPHPSPHVLVVGMKDFEIKMSERVANGLYFVNEEMRCSYVYLAYVYHFGAAHDKTEIGNICKTISSEIGMNKQTIRKIINRIPTEGPNVIQRMEGSGAKKKLGNNNPGLQAAMLALNAGTSPRMAAEICNSVNRKRMGDAFIEGTHTVTRNTLLRTLRAYTDVKVQAILHHKTGSRKADSKWAQARRKFSEQRIGQFAAGEKIDKGEITFTEAMQLAGDVPPLHPDAIQYADEMHTKAVLVGSAGHGGSNSKTQYRVAFDVNSGKLRREKDGGKIPARRVLTQPKFDTECRACYMFAAPKDYNNPDPNKRWEITGKVFEPFSYTGTTMKSLGQYQKIMDGAITKIKSYKHSQWKPFQSAVNNPFQACYVSLHDCTSKLQNPNVTVNLKKHYEGLVKYYDEKYPYLWEVEERLMNDDHIVGGTTTLCY